MADTKISALNTLDNVTVAAADLVPVVDTSANETKAIRYDKLMTPQDVHFRIVGSADETKKVAFEVDGLTTGTTRTLTISDEDGTVVTNNNTVTVNNKTIGSNTGVTLGSDATGDIYYRNASGKLTRLAIGSPNQILNANASGLPEWTANPAATNSSTTANGTVEIATTAEITSGTTTGGTGATLVVPASAVGTAGASKLVQYDSSGKYPAADGSAITNLTMPQVVTMVTNFETSARFTAAVTGTGSHTYNTVGLVQTAPSSSSASVTWNVHQGSGLIYLGNPSFSTRIYVNTQSSTTGSSFFGLGNPTVASSGHTYTVGHIGFKIIRTGGTSTLYATQADGTTETASSALTTVTAGDVLDLYFKYTTGTSAAYYWRKNGGTLSSATTLTTNLPSGTSNTAQFSSSTDNTAGNLDFAYLGASYIR